MKVNAHPNLVFTSNLSILVNLCINCNCTHLLKYRLFFFLKIKFISRLGKTNDPDFKNLAFEIRNVSLLPVSKNHKSSGPDL